FFAPVAVERSVHSARQPEASGSTSWRTRIVSSPPPLCAVLHVSIRAITAGGGFDVPLTLRVLVFDDLAEARHALLLGRGPGGRQRFRVGREGLRKYAVDLVRPAAVVLDDFIRHVRHCCTFAVRAASAPFPKFVIRLCTLRHELRKQRGTSDSMMLVPLFDLKFLAELAAGV